MNRGEIEVVYFYCKVFWEVTIPWTDSIVEVVGGSVNRPIEVGKVNFLIIIKAKDVWGIITINSIWKVMIEVKIIRIVDPICESIQGVVPNQVYEDNLLCIVEVYICRKSILGGI